MLKVIVVGPKYQLNVGYIARIAKNMGVNRLYFVKPRADIHGKKAIMYSKHAHDLLSNAVVYNSIDEAVSGSDVVIGTTGISRVIRFAKMLSLEETLRFLKGKKARSIALLLGRDDTGLRREELERCDIVTHIGSSGGYPVLNISHALAILLYAMAPASKRPEKDGAVRGAINKRELLLLQSLFEKMISGKRIRQRRMVSNVFAKTIRRAGLTEPELHVLLTAFK